MKESPDRARELNDIVPVISSETDERITDSFIDELLLHKEASMDTLEILHDASGPCRERLEKIMSISEEIDVFLATVDDTFEAGNGNRRKIREALALMLKVHINQADRVATGRPFVGHPLSVAQRVLETYREPDAAFVVSAALLHDSIEDQSRLLKLEKAIAEKRESRLLTSQQLDREGALHGLGYIFGLRTQLLVRSVTSPSVLKLDEVMQGTKNDIYLDYIKDIFSSTALTPASAVIKWADLQENALTLHKLTERAEKNDEGGKKALALRDKLKEKYKPVLRAVLNFFKDLSDERHPLFAEREEAIAAIEHALATQYV